MRSLGARGGACWVSPLWTLAWVRWSRRRRWLLCVGAAGEGQAGPREEHTEQQAPHGTTVPTPLRSRMGAMGFNPYRKYRARPLDYILLSAVFLIGLALLAWAVLG